MKIHAAAKVIGLSACKPEKILLARREFARGGWAYEPIGGHIETDFVHQKSETFEECAIREAKEELGIEVMLAEYIGSYYYFWSTKESQCSHYAVFMAHIPSHKELQSMVQDTCSILHIEWISVKTVAELSINICAYGLREVLQKGVDYVLHQPKTPNLGGIPS